LPGKAFRGHTGPDGRLLHFAMVRVLAALTAKLTKLETFGRSLAILGRRVILILTHSALELNNFTSHLLRPFVYPAAVPPGLVRVRARISASDDRLPKYNLKHQNRVPHLTPPFLRLRWDVPLFSLQNFRDRSSAHRAAAFANCKS